MHSHAYSVILLTLCFCLLPVAASAQKGAVWTWHNDNLRDGQDVTETILTPANVNSTSFGKVFSYVVDGHVNAQPLYIPNVSIAGQGTHNVVYVSTENDSVYAFDADGLMSTPLWQVSLLMSGGSAALCPKPGLDCAPSSYLPGITSTPVIDQKSKTLYVVSLKQSGGTNTDYLHALNITTGAEKLGGPVLIQATVPGVGAGSVGGIITFDATHQLQRPGLLLLNGTVYLAWGAFDLLEPWHGWVMGYNATTLAQTAVLNVTANGDHGGIWQSGGGLTADSLGNIFVQTGDGTFDVDSGGVDYGDTFLKLGSSLSVEDYFTPYNQLYLCENDLDAGSGATVILPKQPGTYPDELVGAGKQGLIYLMNRDDMGGFNASQNNVIQTVTGSAAGYTGSAAYWGNAVYFGGNSDYLSRYILKNGLLSKSPVSKSPTIFNGGSTPSVSANGTKNGIVWAVDVPTPLTVPAVLRAYNAVNLSEELYDSSQAGNRDTAGNGISFTVPTIANGKVYIGTKTELDVYGLLP